MSERPNQVTREWEPEELQQYLDESIGMVTRAISGQDTRGAQLTEYNQRYLWESGSFNAKRALEIAEQLGITIDINKNKGRFNP